MALPIDLVHKPKSETSRTPPSVPFVSLSQALSWIAFGFSFDRMALYNVIGMEPFGGLASSQRALSDAVSRLATIATDGSVAMLGKYVHVYSSEINHVLTAPIEAMRFADFAQFDILSDGLRYGRGLTWVFEEKAFEQNSSGRPDGYRSVTVNRDDLMRLFPAKVVIGQPPDALIIPGQSQSNQGGVTSVRRLSDRVLAKWLADLSDGDKMKSQAALWGMCKSEHPDHFIARIRIRAHTPHRKRGRKPIGQKETA